jgi:hypothetical protein
LRIFFGRIFLGEIFWGDFLGIFFENCLDFFVFLGSLLRIFGEFFEGFFVNSKKLRFSKLPILKTNLCRFHRLVLRLVGLIDANPVLYTVGLYSPSMYYTHNINVSE